jgi:4,4'-diaponeurosporenoate glycosyltransferase
MPRLGAPTDAIAVGDGGGRTARAELAVVIPARNEERSLPRLLSSLEAQTLSPAQIVVVDDGSEDATADVALAHPGVDLVRSKALPPGWTGKSWACQQGVDRSSAPTVVLLDADVTLAPEALAALSDEHERRGGLVSVQPHHRVVRPYERLSAAFNVIGVMGVGMATLGRALRPRRDGGVDAAFGPCMVTSRHDYDRIGGHAAVRGDIIEDVALGRRYAAAGLPVHAFGGGRLVSFRMYPDGLGQLVEGWSKNFASGASATAPLRLALVALWVASTLGSVQWLLAAATGAAVVPGLAIVALVVVQQRHVLRQVGTFGWGTALAYPITFAAFVAVFVRSVWLSVVRREVSWRGRPIPLDHDRRWASLPGEAGGAA